MKNNNDSYRKERRTFVLGTLFLLKIYNLFGRKIFNLFFYPVIFFYWCFAKEQRHYSKQYINIIKGYSNQKYQYPINSFQHFIHFGYALLDKLKSWASEIKFSDLNIKNNVSFEDLNTGVLILGSHLGNIEVSRAIFQNELHSKMHVLMDLKQTQQFNKIIKSFNKEAYINVIPIDNIGMDTIIFLENALKNGEHVTILADRLPVTPYHRNNRMDKVPLKFLGEEISLPTGPFLMASLLRVPTYFLTCVKDNNQYIICIDEITTIQKDTHMSRSQNIQYIAEQYINYLEKYCLKYPLEWFNFYDFWKK